MSDKLVTLTELQMRIVDNMTMAFADVLSEAVGKDLRVLMVIAPTTAAPTADDTGKTQVQLISNMEPMHIKRVLKGLHDQVTDKQVNELQKDFDARRAVGSTVGLPN